MNIEDTIKSKSDQLNADDLLNPITIKVSGVKVVSSDQPVIINYVNDGGKPFKPCKSMRRVLVKAWGVDGNSYIGNSMTLYNDPTVKWAGAEIGGIRISHLSHIDKDFKMILATSRGKRQPYLVKAIIEKELTDAELEEWGIIFERTKDLEALKNGELKEFLKGYSKESINKIGELFKSCKK